MNNRIPLEREEYIEQAYLFRHLRERMAGNVAVQEILMQIDQELLSTTRLPYAVQFLAAEVKHTGLLSSGFKRLTHYFSPFQGFVVQGTEDDKRRFSIETALLVLEREALYRADRVSSPGLFVYQLEVISRNRLGYDEGLAAMSNDPGYDDDWKAFLETLRFQVGLIDLAELIYLRSELPIQEHRRNDPAFEPPEPVLFGEKEGKIARANRGRDPLYFFAALQRQLGYPEVPRYTPRDDPIAHIEALQIKIRDLEGRIRLVEGEMRGHVDLKVLGKPELVDDVPEIEIK
jgi:hypothetical protein